jgi:hypothetical protein
VWQIQGCEKVFYSFSLREKIYFLIKKRAIEQYRSSVQVFFQDKQYRRGNRAFEELATQNMLQDLPQNRQQESRPFK